MARFVCVHILFVKVCLLIFVSYFGTLSHLNSFFVDFAFAYGVNCGWGWYEDTWMYNCLLVGFMWVRTSRI